MAVRNVIVLMGNPTINEEEKAIEVLTPGNIVEYSGAGIRKHAGAALNMLPWVALERDELGKDIADTYAINDTVKTAMCYPGCRIYGIVITAQVLVKGSLLESDGAGRLKLVTANAAIADTTMRKVCFRSLEALTTSGDTRVRLEVI